MPSLNERLEAWLNEDPEMRWMEVRVGENLRWCVMLFTVTFTEAGQERLSHHESGTYEGALAGALDTVDKNAAQR